MTCKECVHYNVCEHHAHELKSEGYIVEFDTRDDAEKSCDEFMQKCEWISVDERLPEEYEKCLVVAKVGDRTVIDLAEIVRCYHLLTSSESCEWLITNDWDEGEGCEITHWMPLPEPPKMKGGE